MSLILFWTMMIAGVTALTCSLCGVFLVVKREALISEGLSHAVLPGIILAFLLFQDRTSPWLILTAGLVGLLMVWLVQLISRTKLVEADAALGIIFSGLFSIGVILASLNLEKVHFHPDCILNGDLAYASLNRFKVGDLDFGPRAFLSMCGMLVLVVGFVVVFFKELKLVAFDESLARNFGYRPAVVHSVWLGLVSMTTVAAFETAGTILVVALMIAPAAAANLLSKRLSTMIFVSCAIGLAGAVAGVLLANWLDVPPAPPIATCAGILFLLAFLFAPRDGFFSTRLKRRNQKSELVGQLILEIVARQNSEISKTEVYREILVSPRVVDRAITHLVSERQLRLVGDRVSSIDGLVD